uniref:Fibroblast growth factor receptor like 1a n=1 Tax=Labrus bergylta TaxID=56723 RepID=A0A3Q3FMC0_9LABR
HRCVCVCVCVCVKAHGHVSKSRVSTFLYFMFVSRPLSAVRPRFTQPSKMRKRVIARPVGSSVRLKCTASGNPRPDIVWLKDSRPLVDEDAGAAGRGDGEGKKKRWTLSLKNLTPEHSGKYTCHVSNRAGEINATYKVERTNSKPILTGTHPVNTTVDYGGTTSFQCKVPCTFLNVLCLILVKGWRPPLCGPAYRGGLVTPRWILPQQVADNARQGGGRRHVHLPGSQHDGLQLQECLPYCVTR